MRVGSFNCRGIGVPGLDCGQGQEHGFPVSSGGSEAPPLPAARSPFHALGCPQAEPGSWSSALAWQDLW